MKNPNIDQNINYSCSISNTRLYTSDNNDLIYIKPYKGDWGDWDEQPVNNTPLDNCGQEHININEAIIETPDSRFL